MPYKIDTRLFFILIIAFIIATVIGTVSHECGHYIAARVMGFKAHISYGMTKLVDPVKSMNNKERLWFTLAGPLQTIITGSIGLLLLYRSVKPASRLSAWQWCLVFITLFWLRQTANLLTGATSFLIKNKFPSSGDEIKLSRYFHLPDAFLIILTGITGLLILILVLLKFIPQNQRFTFIIAGLVGGIAGYLFWLTWFGKIIMP